MAQSSSARTVVLEATVINYEHTRKHGIPSNITGDASPENGPRRKKEKLTYFVLAKANKQKVALKPELGANPHKKR